MGDFVTPEGRARFPPPKRLPFRGLDAIEAVLRVHSGHDFEADDFPTLEEGVDAWQTWADVRATVEEMYPDA